MLLIISGKSIGAMKKAEEMKTMTADEARVFAWKDGKARNLRALLCSLDTVLWESGNARLVVKERTAV